ncbi:MAG: PilT/PilU family type 4a pilus ATPase, partial [Polyangiales bacterium]
IGSVGQLERFLQYLDRGDVTEIVFQSGATAAAKKKGELRPVTREPLSAKHILTLMTDTPLQKLVPAADGSTAPTPTRINGVDYVATIARSGQMLLLRVRREDRDTVPPEAAIRPIHEQAAPVREEAEPEPEAPSSPPLSADLVAEIPRSRPRRSYRPSPEASPVRPFAPGSGTAQGSAALRRLLTEARVASASDVHLMSGEPARFRENGYLIPRGQPLGDEHVKSLVMPLLDQRSTAQFDELGYADFACEVEGAGRLRVNVSKQRTGVKGSFRLIMAEPPTLSSLGLPKELRQMLEYHQGLVVVSGPSGAGKSTTLAALVDLFNAERAVHIITIEDPVEIIHPIRKAIVSQREVGSHTMSFHSALKGSLREDPDVIAIGELRDRETVEKALEAAETGHLVFATMSTPSGATAIDRLIDMFPPDDQSQVRATLAGALKFVVSQRLVPRSDRSGQVVAVELLTGGMALWSLIRDDKLFQLPSLLQRGRGFGMIRIEDSLNALLGSGVITAETAKTFANDPRLIGQAPSGDGRPASPRDAGAGRKVGVRSPLSKKES